MKKTQTIDNEFGIEKHIIICNWSEKADLLISELHDPSLDKKRPIIIITENPQAIPDFDKNEKYRGIMIVKGNPSHEEALKRAGVVSASTVIILADRELGDVADTKTIMTAIAIDHINPSIHVVAEVLQSLNVPYFSYTHVDEIICLELLTERLLAQSCLTPGISFIFSDLLTQSKDTNEIYVEDIPSKYIGQTFLKLKQAIVSLPEEDIILIGIGGTIPALNDAGDPILNNHGQPYVDKYLSINPKSSQNSNGSKYNKDYIMKEGDKVYVIAYTKPDLNDLLKD